MPIFVHTNLDNFEPILMEKDSNGGDTYMILKMFPPNFKIEYFFS